jgi:hypothetical protein
MLHSAAAFWRAWRELSLSIAIDLWKIDPLTGNNIRDDKLNSRSSDANPATKHIHIAGMIAGCFQ